MRIDGIQTGDDVTEVQDKQITQEGNRASDKK